MEWILPLLTLAGLLVWAMTGSRPKHTELAREVHQDQPRPPAESAPARRRAEIEESATQFSLECVVMSDRLDLIEIADPPLSKTHYAVNLQEQTCSCPLFRLRSERPKNCFGRWCKHLIQAFRNEGAFENASEWHKAIADSDHEGPIVALLVKRKTSPDVLIARGDSAEWLNVYARTRRSGEKIADASGPIGRFGWSLPEQRWAWGEGPPGARELRRMLKVVQSLDNRSL